MKEHERPDPPTTGDERATLTGFLDYQRATLEWKCDRLDAEQLARRAMPPSTLSLLGLVRHMAEVERGWFDRVEGTKRGWIYATSEDRDADFNGAVADPAVVDDAFAQWRAEVEHAREVTAGTDLGATFVHPRSNEEISLRWVLSHMIEEYARHNGHADLLREAIDGETGE
jgi:uncharacterized damage-inducible protein DinB